MTAPNAKLPHRDILRAHIEGGMSRDAIAERYKCHPESVNAKLRLEGLTHLLPKPVLPMHKLVRASVEADLKAGLRLAQIDRKYDVPSGTSKRFAETQGISLVIPGKDVRDDRIIYVQRYTRSKSGGSAFMPVSLPRISSLVAHLEALL